MDNRLETDLWTEGSELMETALYFSSLPSKISSTSDAFKSVIFVAKECGPNPNDEIRLRSSTLTSLRHREGYLLYRDPLNIRI